MLLTKTSELAIQCLLVLAQKPAGYLINPAELAAQLGTSPTYTSKVLRLLVRGGVVRSRRGAAGGFELVRAPAGISLLDVVEICQGTIPGNYCGRAEENDACTTCGYHLAMHDLRDSTRAALARWSLRRVLATGRPRPGVAGCMMGRIRAVKPKDIPA